MVLIQGMILILVHFHNCNDKNWNYRRCKLEYRASLKARIISPCKYPSFNCTVYHPYSSNFGVRTTTSEPNSCSNTLETNASKIDSEKATADINPEKFNRYKKLIIWYEKGYTHKDTHGAAKRSQRQEAAETPSTGVEWSTELDFEDLTQVLHLSCPRIYRVFTSGTNDGWISENNFCHVSIWKSHHVKNLYNGYTEAFR